jgi:hypothetical protein
MKQLPPATQPDKESNPQGAAPQQRLFFCGGWHFSGGPWETAIFRASSDTHGRNGLSRESNDVGTRLDMHPPGKKRLIRSSHRRFWIKSSGQWGNSSRDLVIPNALNLQRSLQEPLRRWRVGYTACCAVCLSCLWKSSVAFCHFFVLCDRVGLSEGEVLGYRCGEVCERRLI